MGKRRHEKIFRALVTLTPKHPRVRMAECDLPRECAAGQTIFKNIIHTHTPTHVMHWMFVYAFSEHDARRAAYDQFQKIIASHPRLSSFIQNGAILSTFTLREEIP